MEQLHLLDPAAGDAKRRQYGLDFLEAIDTQGGEASPGLISHQQGAQSLRQRRPGEAQLQPAAGKTAQQRAGL